MQPRRKKRLFSILLIISLIAGAIGAMLYALQQNIDLFYTPTQLVEGLGKDKVKPVVGQRLRIGGMVVQGTVSRDAQSLKVRFQLVDTGPTVWVEFEGILPDLFREGQGIVAQGTLLAPDVIKASEVLAKHDEEYMPAEVAEAMKGIRHVPPSQANFPVIESSVADGYSNPKDKPTY
ncbi:cytochrome c maturation protein CcmE [Arsukibacterium perlucidum]|uniref:cytochrome c maturation protein CcmE n=1 Tax=Arsukibacterium perlucidum TaxID=368811 RepID=UPI0003663DCD|nr:cytochrome c maturation protein CcmE [Arsukibacterium perlucidum]